MNPAEIELMASVEAEHWWYRGLRDAIGGSLLGPKVRIPARPRVLDAGCGTGENLSYLKRLLRPAYTGGFDLSPLAVRHCREKVRGADVYVSDIRDPEVHCDDLDLVLSCDVVSIAGLRESTDGLSRLVSRLRRGGTLILNLPAFSWLKSRHDLATSTRDRVTTGQVRRLLTQLDMSIEVVSYRVFSLFPAIVLARLPSMLRRKTPSAVPALGWAGPAPNKRNGVIATGAAETPSTEARSDLRLAPKWINPLLYPILHLENALVLRGMRFPWGSSVYAVARKP
jgi:SAM-dependent methyltransferase